MANGDRILVTGASGFVGRHLIDRLRTLREIEVLALAGPRQAGGADLTDNDACRRAIEDFSPIKVVHLAAQSSVGVAFSDPDAVWRANFDATRNLARALAGLKRRPHLIFASSAEVYGASFNLGPRSEGDPLAPQSPYGRSKAAAEMLLADMAGDRLAVTTLRLFNHTGPGQDRRFAVPSFAAQIAAAEVGSDAPTIRVGNLDARRDFTDVEDMVDAYVAVIMGEAPDGARVFNTGSGQDRRIGDLLEHMLGLSNNPIRVELDAGRMRPSDIPVAAGDFSKFADAFGWRPRRAIEDTLAAVLEWERLALATPADDEAC